MATERDRKGRLTRHFYDGVGRRTSTRDPQGRVIAQVWCACGSVDALVDANGNKTTWERDWQNRVTRELRADGVTDTLYTYDLTGRLKTVTDPKNQVTTHVYGLDDSLTSTAYTNAVIATPGVSYTYDPIYSRVLTVADGIGTTTYAYKTPGTLGAGQVASVDGPLANDTITYTYDPLGRVTVRAINGAANTVTWAFDALGRVISEANVLGTFSYTYEGVTSRLATVAYPNGQTSTYSYLPTNQDHRLQTIHHKYPGGATLSKFDYTYDAAGNIMSWRQQADTTAVLWKYGYDAADQLTAAVKESTDPTPVIQKRYAYGYDPAGNRLFEQIDDQVTAASHDNLNRLLTHSPGGTLQFVGSVNEPATVRVDGQPAVVDSTNVFRGTGVTAAGTTTVTITATDPSGNAATQQYEVDVTGAAKTFTYDANGNMTGDGARTFEWDARNQLVAVNHGNLRFEWQYDGSRRRASLLQKESGVVTSTKRLVWDGTAVVESRSGADVVEARYFAHGETTGSSERIVLRDHLATVRVATDQSGAVASRREFGPLGEIESTVGIVDTARGFGGQHDAPLGLMVAPYRHFDPSLGLWLSEDPIGLHGGGNRYSYVERNPVRFVDPLGLRIDCFVSTRIEFNVQKTVCEGNPAGCTRVPVESQKVHSVFTPRQLLRVRCRHRSEDSGSVSGRSVCSEQRRARHFADASRAQSCRSGSKLVREGPGLSKRRLSNPWCV